MSYNYSEISVLPQRRLSFKSNLQRGGLKFKKPLPKPDINLEEYPVDTDEDPPNDETTEETETTGETDETTEEETTKDEETTKETTKEEEPKKKLSFKRERQPVQFDEDGIPIATKSNVDRMSERDLMEFCPKWTLDKINPLIVELADYVNIPMSSSKPDKCRALLKYKKDHPRGTQTKQIDYTDTYESFNWRPESKIEYKNNTFELQHSMKFRQFIIEMFQHLRLTDKNMYLNRVDPDDDTSTMKYQQFPQEYLDPMTPFRSLLLYHGLGSGKTKTAVETSTRFLNNNMKVLVLVPGALRLNFITELYTWGSQKHGVGIKNYKQLQGSAKIQAEKAASKVIQHYYDILTYNEKGVYDKLNRLTNPTTGQLENRLIIVDEIHNLVSRMSKVTNLSRQVYHFLMDKLYNCKLLVMSGTPLLNDAYELGVLFNILNGKFRLPNRDTYTLFQENPEEFNDKFVNIYDKSVINGHLFKRRINGKVSYYAGTTDKKGMAETIKHPIQKLEMSDHQFELYLQERYLETRKEKKGSKKEAGASGSAFRTYSRMVCNFAFPSNIIRPKPVSSRDTHLFEKYKSREIDTTNLEDIQDEYDTTKIEDSAIKQDSTDQNKTSSIFDTKKGLTKKQREETYIKLLQEALEALEEQADEVFPPALMKEYGPKMAKIYENITTQTGKDGLIYIYTEFRILEGVRIMGSLLQYHGYNKVDYTDINSFQDFKRKYPHDPKKPQPRYGIISSDEDSKQRKVLLEIYNHPENAHGEYIKVIMGTAASSEGISLLRVRQIHIMEPYWNMVRNDQVIGRGVRYKSHLDLPEDEQNVHIYQYQMTLTQDQTQQAIEYLNNPKESDTSDEHIYKLAMTKDVINRQFLKMIKESAIDCGLNYLMNTKLDPDLQCLDVPPDLGKYMYMPDINQDPEDQNYMKNIKFEEYLVSPIKFNNITYGYKANPNGKPLLSPPSIVHENNVYYNILTLYNYEMLKSGVEVKEKYYVIGTNILINA